MKAIRLHKFRSAPLIEKIPLPKPSHKPQVLVKVKAAQANPSDFAFISGIYRDVQSQQFPCTLGFEGAGVVQQLYNVSEQQAALFPKGATVAFKGSKVWAEYCLVDINHIHPVDSSVDFKYMAGATINPYTAILALQFVERAISEIKQEERFSIIQSGASTSVGRTIARLAARRRIHTFNLVRGDHNVEDLEACPEFKSTKLMSVINTNDEDYKEKLQSQIQKNVAPIAAFDCIGSQFVNTLLHSMRNEGTLYHYGILSLKPMIINFGAQFVFSEKSVRGLNLQNYTRKNHDFILKHWKLVNEDLKLTSEGKFEESIFASKIGFEVDFTDFEEAIRSHKRRMSQGKVILKFKQ